MHRQLELDRLRAGWPVQLHRWGELDSLPPPWRPTERTWALYELRGDEPVGVPTSQPGEPRPREWTV